MLYWYVSALCTQVSWDKILHPRRPVLFGVASCDGVRLRLLVKEAEMINSIGEADLSTKPSDPIWYPLVICYIAMENSPFIDDFPIKTSIYESFPWLC